MSENESGPGDDEGAARTAEAEAPGERQLGTIVPAPPRTMVLLVDGPYAGRLMSREGWNGAVRLARSGLSRGRKRRAELGYRLAEDMIVIPLVYERKGS